MIFTENRIPILFFSEAAQRIVVTGVNDIPTTIEKGNMYFFLQLMQIENALFK